MRRPGNFLGWGEVVFCPRCGSRNNALRLWCASCHKVLRPIFSLALAVVLFVLALIEWTAYLWKILPSYAVAAQAAGDKIYSPITLAVRASRSWAFWWFIFVPPELAVLIFVAFFWKPHKSYGPNLVLSFAVIKMLAIQVAFFMTIFQLFRYICH